MRKYYLLLQYLSIQFYRHETQMLGVLPSNASYVDWTNHSMQGMMGNQQGMTGNQYFFDPWSNISQPVNFLEPLCLMLNISLLNCSCARTVGLCDIMGWYNNTTLATMTPEHKRPSSYTLTYTSIALLAGVCGAAGNAIVLFVAWKRRQNLPAIKLHMAELAIINFMFSVVQLMNAFPLLWTNRWIYGLSMCRVTRTLLEIGSMMTILFIMIIAIERFYLIIYPLKKHLVDGISKHVSVVVATIIVIATIIPFYFGLGIEKSSGRCIQFQVQSSFSLSYHWFVMTVYSIIPVCIITVLYAKIIAHISRQIKSKNTANQGTVFEKNVKRNRRIVIITLTILGCFVICTLPIRTIIIYFEMREGSMKMTSSHYEGNDHHLYLALTFFAYITYPFQSTLNPLLYSFVDSEWRRELRRVLHIRNNQVRDVNGNDARDVRGPVVHFDRAA